MRLLQLKPQIRQYWTALAVAHHLQGDPVAAVKVLAAFEDTLKVYSFLRFLTAGGTTAK
jgi:N-alpha-acetyltransferase 15/16, NatA auxiliary subunit